MKLPWFYHSSSGQLSCSCPPFVIVLVLGLCFGGKPADCPKVVLTLLLFQNCSVAENRKMAERFALLDENELNKIPDKCKNGNTADSDQFVLSMDD